MGGITASFETLGSQNRAVSRRTVSETVARKTRMSAKPLAARDFRSSGPGRLIGYVRVSTEGQNTNLQWDALLAAGADPIFEDRITGVSRCRDGLDRALAAVRSGDRIMIWKMDRLGRSLGHVMTIIEALGERGVSLVSLQENLDTGTEAGQLYSAILAMIAHVERSMIASRTRAGLQAAKARGVRLGAKPKMTPEQAIEARALMRSGLKAEAVAARYAVGRATLFRHTRVIASSC